MISWIRHVIQQYQRWKLADAKGWSWASRVLRANDEKEAEQAVRNSNRFYRLTRDNGNPWRA